MPRVESSAPRKKLPPPTTIAISTSLAASAISLAMPLTTSGLTPREPPPNASPESLRRTRRLGSDNGVPLPVVEILAAPEGGTAVHGKGPPSRSSRALHTLVLRADLEAGEAAHGQARVGEDLRDGDLV